LKLSGRNGWIRLAKELARSQLKALQKQAKYLAMSDKEVSKEIKRLEKEMLQAAKNLEFERATPQRDQL
jgi:excinuclease ABC subunit B